MRGELTCFPFLMPPKALSPEVATTLDTFAAVAAHTLAQETGVVLKEGALEKPDLQATIADLIHHIGGTFARSTAAELALRMPSHLDDLEQELNRLCKIGALAQRVNTEVGGEYVALTATLAQTVAQLREAFTKLDPIAKECELPNRGQRKYTSR